MSRRSLTRCFVAASVATRAVTGIGWPLSFDPTAQWLRREDPVPAMPPSFDGQPSRPEPAPSFDGRPYTLERPPSFDGQPSRPEPVPSFDDQPSRPERPTSFDDQFSRPEVPPSFGDQFTIPQMPPGRPKKPALKDEELVQWLETHAHVALPTKEYLEKNVHLAQLALNGLPDVKVSTHIFLQNVVPFRHLDEPVDDWRELFYTKLRPLVANATSLRQIAEIVIPATFNGGLGRVVEFKSNQTPEVMAPVSETLARGYASCTGTSILLANALRAVGVPTRIVGTGHWRRPDGGNHNWVEFWTEEDGGGWHFTDAVPVDKAQIDKAWFVPEPTQHAIPYSLSGIYTHVWDASQADAAYLLTWRDPPVSVPALDRTEAYLKLSRVNQN